MTDTFVLFHHEIVKKFDGIVSTVANQPEIGGILVGTKRKEHIEVLSYTSPGSADISQIARFIKKDTSHQKFARLQWSLSKGTQTYMGEWHTHPSGFPMPSTIDINTWRNVVKKQKRSMIFVIISPTGWAPYLALMNEDVPIIGMKKHEEGKVGIVYSTI